MLKAIHAPEDRQEALRLKFQALTGDIPLRCLELGGIRWRHSVYTEMLSSSS